MAELLGTLVPLEVDFTGVGSTYRTLVCLQNFDLEVSSNIDTQETDCGQINTPGIPGSTVNFTAVCEVTPGGSQATYKDCLAAQVANTKVKVRVQNPTVQGASIGTAFFVNYDAYFNNVTLQKQTGAVITFTGTITSTGPIDVTP
jgi:hypothetical protein